MGGVLFAAAGAAALVAPAILTTGIRTGIHIHNLDRIGVGTLHVALVVVVAVATVGRTVRRLRRLPESDRSGEGGHTDAPVTPACRPGTRSHR